MPGAGSMARVSPVCWLREADIGCGNTGGQPAQAQPGQGT